MSGKVEAEVQPANFTDYGKKAARRFLRTAIVIDDDISAQAEVDGVEVVEAPPFLVANRINKPAMEDDKEESTSEEDADVPIKPLADAFLDKQIICGVLKPTKADEGRTIIERAVRAALVADIVIIDWYLRKGDESLALSILGEILGKDRDAKGRLRLILVYTSAVPLNARRDALVEHLDKQGFNCNRIGDEELLLQIDNCRIKFVQKKYGENGAAVTALPELAIEEFARHSSGLLSNFALLGIGALRDTTHHLLSTFDRRIDPAFVGHRLLVREEEGARGLAMSLFMLQIKGLLSLPEHLGSALNNEEISAWFDDRFAYAEAEDQLKAAGTEKQVLKNHLLGDLDLPRQPKNLHKALFVPEAHEQGVDPSSIDDKVSKDFARLATFVREFNGFNLIPARWLPTLTLGSVVKATIDNQVRYLLCVQPACDTVRIDSDRYFPFIDLIINKVSRNSENLVIRDGGDMFVVRVNSKAGARHYDKFSPNEQTLSIRANEKVDAGKIAALYFESVNGIEYEWLGDIDAMKAQRIAVDLSGELARVGIDEYEWLRQGGLAGK